MIAITGFVSGCTTTSFDESKLESERINKAAVNKMSEMGSVSNTPNIARFVDDDFIVGGKFDASFHNSDLPSFFSDSYTFRSADRLTFSELVSHVNNLTNVRIDVLHDAYEKINGISSSDEDDDEIEVDDEELDISLNPFDKISDAESGNPGSNVLFNIDFEGTLSDFLTHTLSRIGLSWEWIGDRVEIYHMKEETFILDQDMSMINLQSTLDGGSGSSHKFSSATGISPFMEEITTALDTMISEGGKYSVSSNLSTVTVTDTPSNLRRIKRVIDRYNDIASKQIMMRVQVFDIDSNKSGDYGIDWNMLFSESSRLTGELGTSFLPVGDSLFGISTLDANINTTAAINALSEMSNVTTSINTNIHTTNGRPVPFSIGDKEEYIADVQKSSSDGDDTWSWSTATMDTGFVLNLQPRITSNGQISISMGLDISEGELVTRNFGDSDVFLPHTQARSFIQKARSRNGQPIMLAGFERQVEDGTESRISEGTSWLAGGRNQSNSRKTMTVIVITPYIMR